MLTRIVLHLAVLLAANCSAFVNFADVTCGLGKTARIVGGEESSRGEFPWIVSIKKRGGHLCGGTIINSQWVLTAGHCLCTGGFVMGANVLKVGVGEHDISKRDTSSVYPVSKITLHPDFVCTKYIHDIGLLELTESVSWTRSVKPACFPGINVRQSDVPAIAAGWGWTDEDASKGVRSNVLQKVQVEVVDNRKCRDWYKSQGKKTKILDTQMCAGTEKGGKDTCWADSGGPLMLSEGRGDLVVAGIVSTGIGCGRPKLPGLYTRITEYLPWISETISR